MIKPAISYIAVSVDERFSAGIIHLPHCFSIIEQVERISV